jgi:hypothetical protein
LRFFISIAFQRCFRISIAKVQENQVGLKLSGTHQLLAYADDMNLLGVNIGTVNNKETLIDGSKEAGVEVRAEKTKYMLVYRYQNAGQNRDMKIATGHLKMCHSSSIWHESNEPIFDSGGN